MFRKIVSFMMMVMCLVMFTSCGNVKTLNKTTDKGTVESITYDTYGFLNKSNKENPNVRYELIIGNIIWAVILCETIIAPIYFIGFSLYQPTSYKLDKFVPGKI